jgi:hypothetical protein
LYALRYLLSTVAKHIDSQTTIVYNNAITY